MARRRRRPQRKTLLAVGEGDTELAFLKYLRSVYCCDRKGPKVTVKNAHGKGPENVLDMAIRHQRSADYDRTIAVLDTDLEWTTTLRKKARRYRIDLIGNTPCIEGLFLSMLGVAVPGTSKACKTRLRGCLRADTLDPGSYEKWCTRKLLDSQMGRNPELSRLMRYYSEC